ncbi:MAG: hypothetical protein HQK76_03440 [Desulfobacterales bacterium]|nr:hypothetical protein [Desulfobacterales bacterium]
MKSFPLALGLFLSIVTTAASGKEIGFIEDFSLSDDRNIPLNQLIPGTEDYYYYTCLNYLNNGNMKDTAEVLKLWLKRYGRTILAREIEYRKALLEYDNHSKSSLKYISSELGLLFNHQKDIQDKKPDLPSVLDAKLISRDTLLNNAYRIHGNTTNGFENSAFEWLLSKDIHPDLRRHILSQLKTPYYQNLPKLVIDDLKYRYSSGFGSLEIHSNLLKEQLDECVQLMPNLANESAFVNTYLIRLKPNEDVDIEYNAKEKEKYLDRLWDFASKLNPVHNSLKVTILYYRLLFDQSIGIYDKERFMTYLSLPKSASYVNSDYLRKEENKRYIASINQDFSEFTFLLPVNNDEPLIRDYLMHFFVTESDYSIYIPYINDIYLKEYFAETKILNGIGDMEKWYSMLNPQKYQSLKERIDIEFSKQNQIFYSPDSKVELDIYIKNIQTLIVKVYKINTISFYQTNNKEINTDIDLDGLVPNNEYVYKYDDSPLRQTLKHFEFPELNEKGIYVIEFIGSGKSSRAIIKKSRLKFIESSGISGHVFTVFDEQNNKINDASLYIGGHEYKSNEKGTITVPFTTNPQKESVIIIHKNFASLDYFNHKSEEYSLSAGIYVDRESILKQNKAKVLIRPSLSVSGTKSTVKVLEKTVLVINSTDIDGISTSKEIKNFAIYDDKESVYEFAVPERLSSVSFELKATVKNVSQNKDYNLSVTKKFDINEIDKTEKIECIHLSKLTSIEKKFLGILGSKTNESYAIDVLGKNGEPLSERSVNLALKHKDFKNLVYPVLQTDPNGRIILGSLDDIEWIEAKGPEQTPHKWYLMSDSHNYFSLINYPAESSIFVPYMGKNDKPDYSEIALLEVRGGRYFKDCFNALSIKDGFIKIDNLPEGDYELWLKPFEKMIQIKLTGKEKDVKTDTGYITGENRFLEIKNPIPLQISTIYEDGDNVYIKLENASKYARIHIFADRYLPAFSPFECLGNIDLFEAGLIKAPKTKSIYLSGRDIGDEYRYVIDRQYLTKFSGNMLKRPGLLLNPWAISDTTTGRQDAQSGEQWGEAPLPPSTSFVSAKAKPSQKTSDTDFANIDFLLNSSVCFYNLKPDQNGIVSIDRSKLSGKPNLNVIAVDFENTVYKNFSLKENEFSQPKTKDLKLVLNLNSSNHYIEKKNIAVVKPSSEFILADILTSELEAYDSLEKVYRLFTTLSNNANLNEFSFILKWPELSPSEKLEKYSKYSCHELNFFIYKKDNNFFNKVVAPYIKNKKDKTFIDYLLIHNSGDNSIKSKISEFLNPWNYQKLNIVERILIGKALNDGYSKRHIKDILDLIPPNIEQYNHLFNTALKTSALDTEKGFGFEDTKRKMREEAEMEMYDAAPELEASEKMEMGRSFDAKTQAAPSPRKMSSETAGKRSKSAKKDSAVRPAAPMAMMTHLADDMDDNFYLEERKKVQRLYQKLDKTKEYAENNYYNILIENQNEYLVKVNRFWLDFANHDDKQSFFSSNVAEASTNFTEMMFALSVLDIPFSAKEHKTTYDKNKMILKAESPIIIYSKEIQETKISKSNQPILVSQNFFMSSDRYIYENNESIEKYISEEFLLHVVYGCQIIITNPSTSRKKLDVLIQIPQGAIPVNKSQYTNSIHINIGSYATKTLEYYFYFPQKGKYPHYPVHVSQNENLIAYNEPFTFNVVEKLSKIDKTSWDYVSQNGSDEDVIEYLNQNNINRLNLERIAFRLKNKAFFDKITEVLKKRHVYHNTVWSYSIYHNNTKEIREYLQNCDSFVNSCGAYIDCKILTIDPIIRKSYQHLEYEPLVNARAHKLGKKLEIQNDKFYNQYQQLLKVLSYRPRLNDDDIMSLTYYMFLQDRIEDGLKFFEKVKPENLVTKIQYDYFKIYSAFYKENTKQALEIAKKYADYPVNKWKTIFVDSLTQLEEIETGKTKTLEKFEDKDKTAINTALASTSPSFDFTVEEKIINLNYQNLESIEITYYLMDIELLFSRNPFVKEFKGHFSNILPNETQNISLSKDKNVETVPIPERFANSNVMIEISGKSIKKQLAVYYNSLNVQMVENYGQLRVADKKSDKPLSKIYIKVYALMKDGVVNFYKDGYTDLRGIFDYTSLNTNEIDNVEKFSVLIMSDKNGTLVKEASPPKR